MKALTKCRSGYVPCNRLGHRDAEYLFYLPGFGFVRFAFGDGTFLENSEDEEDRGCDAYLDVALYCLPPEDGVWEGVDASLKATPRAKSGLLLGETDGGTYLYRKRDYPGGDMRDMMRDAARSLDLPDPKRMFLVSSSGTWDRPRPKGAR